MEGKYIVVASGPVVIVENKLLLTKDGKDPFYKIPGGRVKEGESLEATCVRELKEETGLDCVLFEKLSTQKLNRNPKTNELAEIELHHYRCGLKNKPKNFHSYEYDGHQVVWVDLRELFSGKVDVAPNVKYLIEKGDIK